MTAGFRGFSFDSPTMTDHEVAFIMDAIESTASNFREWVADYHYDASSNEFMRKDEIANEKHDVGDCFNSGYRVDPREVGVNEGDRY